MFKIEILEILQTLISTSLGRVPNGPIRGTNQTVPVTTIGEPPPVAFLILCKFQSRNRVNLFGTGPAGVNAISITLYFDR